MRSTTSIKDPMVKGDVVYEVPARFISPTAGLKGKGHRSCLCRLFLEGRCGQGSKCKSFHVDKNFVDQKRLEVGAELEENFITEVVVTNGQTVYAVRFPAVIRTQGLDDYRKDFANGVFTPKMLCPDHSPNTPGQCLHDKDCSMIHVKHAELNSLNPKRLRTPCCSHHGDDPLRWTAGVNVFDESTDSMITIPTTFLAGTEAIHKIRKNRTFTSKDICRPHITSRCKYGRSCGNLHVCRVWWKDKKPAPKACQKQPVFAPDNDFGDLLHEESFGLPVWDQNKPYELPDFDGFDVCQHHQPPAHCGIDIFAAFSSPPIGFPVEV
eukprot:TRINITY_DN2473_c3_g2_i1.p1 TRINITY_DN2473_c3_g2~~TRINITY_DN2473_c3_g2_i1.p1  ORF type:complete len:356 (+),score=30.47 TRINITY_DN2473_c3_g2_i1:102-1070(+)